MRLTLHDPGEFAIYRDPERPYLTCTPDRLVMRGDKIVAPLELKTAHFSAARIWAKEVPPSYLCQMQTQMHVLQCNHAYVAVLLEGRDFRWFKIERHQKFIDRLMKRIDHFWFEHVVKRVPPPTDYHKATSAALLRKYPVSTGKVIELPDELEPLYEELQSLTAAENAAKKRKEEIKNYVKPLIGDARYGRFLSGKGFQWSGENGSRRFTAAKKCPEPTGSSQRTD